MKTYLPGLSLKVCVADAPGFCSGISPTAPASDASPPLTGSAPGALSVLMTTNSCGALPVFFARTRTLPAFTDKASGWNSNSVMETAIGPPVSCGDGVAEAGVVLVTCWFLADEEASSEDELSLPHPATRTDETMAAAAAAAARCGMGGPHGVSGNPARLPGPRDGAAPVPARASARGHGWLASSPRRPGRPPAGVRVARGYARATVARPRPHPRQIRRARVLGLWEAFNRGGVGQMLPLVDERTEWLPLSAEGRVLRGREEIAAFFEALAAAGQRLESRPYAVEDHGPCVLVSASLRQAEAGGFAERTVHYVFTFEADRLRRASGHRTREEADEELARCRQTPG